MARFFLLVATAFAAVTVGCEREVTPTETPSASPSPATDSVVKIASLVPAATDLLIGMDAKEHLVAISNYDIERDETRGLPKVGDYQTVDWERLQSLKPSYLVIFQNPDRVPAGMKRQAESLGVKFINVRTETLEQIFEAIGVLGNAIDRPDLARSAEAKLRAELDAVRVSVRGKPKIPALIVRDEKARGVVGRDTFLNELLEIAGGQNIIETTGWPEIDRERLTSLKPQVIIQLLSDASPQVEQQARRVWTDLPMLPAVQDGRVHLINEWYTQQPGYHVAQLARQMAEALHGTPPNR